jgi:ubiquinone/menaquinone biosynthesis C-methylase UbiE
MKADREVERLFNAKAKTWSRKYEPGGRLVGRAAMFLELVERFLSRNDRVLDLGCGTGAIASRLAAHGFKLTACDVAKEMIETGKKNYPNPSIEWLLLSSGWEQFPFGPHTFEGIVASSVFEYLTDLDNTFAECHRTLKPGGLLFATVPNSRSVVRMLEKLLRPLATLGTQLPMFNHILRFRAYTSYLKHSRNRMPLTKWLELGRRTRFSAVKWGKCPGSKGALVFLVFRKHDDKPEEPQHI